MHSLQKIISIFKPVIALEFPLKEMKLIFSFEILFVFFKRDFLPDKQALA